MTDTGVGVTKGCNTRDCKSRHHTLMHGTPRLSSFSSNASSSRSVSTTTVAVFPLTSTTSASTSSGYVGSNHRNRLTWLPIVPLEIKASGLTTKTFALLDIGSEVTLVKGWITDLLGFGRPINSICNRYRI